ncbi:MAG: class I SAM-dependent methyltransferase [Coriobacteriales bacterium]|nr:class I SAM-dependent methyltransferase [Coriobacteriales bacterium]
MNDEVAKSLITLNNEFYKNNAESFSNTRQRPWDGWIKLLDQDYFLQLFESKSKLRVLDYACGNLRFEKFLSSAFEDIDFEFYCIDNCQDLMECAKSKFSKNETIEHKSSNASYYCYAYDLLDFAVQSRLDALIKTIPTVDLCVCFGFFHHIPTQDLRKTTLLRLLKACNKNSLLAISFWNFVQNNQTKLKHQTSTMDCLTALKDSNSEIDLRDLDPQDYILGWKNTPGQYRYCHNFDDAQIETLLESVDSLKSCQTHTFRADGKSGFDNIYKVLKVN